VSDNSSLPKADPAVTNYLNGNLQLTNSIYRTFDIVIAVMGVTGSGKSSFVSLFTNGDVPIGHSLESCKYPSVTVLPPARHGIPDISPTGNLGTSEIQPYRCPIGPIRLILIDTPGFDDTYKSDTEVLREIAGYLSLAYSNQVKLAGIVYLHRITDPRIQGSAMRNLRMFKKLCGNDSLGNVVLATTWWDRVDPDIGVTREKELIDTEDFWGGMIKNGSRVFRHLGNLETGMEIVNYLIAKQRRVVLDIQHQMVDLRMPLDQTEAGKEVESERLKLKAEFEKKLKDVQEEKEEALREKDEESAKMLAKFENDYTQKLQQFENDRIRLQENMEALRRQREDDMRQSRERFDEEMRRNKRTIEDQRREIQKIKDQYELTHKRNNEEGLFTEVSAIRPPPIISWTCCEHCNGCGGVFTATKATLLKGLNCPHCGSRRLGVCNKR
jgi:hypothetical protein